MLLIEERGTNLRLLFPDGAAVFVPERRHTGIEFLVVPAGEPAMLVLEPRYASSPGTSFRVTAHELGDAAQLAAAQALTQAGALAGRGTQDALEQACASYEAVASVAALPRAWSDTAVLLAAGCNLAIGRANAPELLDRVDAVQATLGLLPYNAEWLRGRHHYLQGQFERATAHYERSLATLRALSRADASDWRGIEQDEADLINDLAITLVVRSYRAIGDERAALLARARSLFDEALALAMKHENHLVLANIYNYIAQVYFVEGNDQGLIEYLQLARMEAEQTGDPDEVVFILGSIGDYYKKWGQFRRALDAYLQVVRMLESGSRLGRGGDSFHNLANLYHALGDLPRAKELTERAIELFAAAANPYRTNILNYELGTILEEQGDLVTAQELLAAQVAYMETRETPWEPIRMMTQAAYSRVEAKLGNQQRALQLSNEIFAHPELLRTSSSTQAVPVYVNHADRLHAAGDAQGAIALLQQALTEVAVQPTDKIEILAHQLAVHQQQGQTGQALEIAQQAFGLIENQQTQLETARLGPYWSGKVHAVYMAHADYLLAHQHENPGFRELAFSVAERARASSLRLRRQEMLLASTEKDAAAEREWQQLMLEAQRGFAATDSDLDALALERRISEARERYFAQHGNIPEVQLQPLSLEEMVRRIPAGTLMIEFLAGPDNVWRYEVSRAGWKVTNLGPTRQVQTSIDAALYELQQPDRRRDNLQQLSDLLLAGLEFAPEQGHLLISPTAELNSIPFAALMYEGAYLGQRATLTLTPSSSEYFSQERPAPRMHSREIAVLADPVFGEFAQPLALAGSGEVFRSWTSTLSPLPATAREAQALGSFYPEQERLILTGSAATARSFFAPEVRNARIIHLATHGYFNEQLPELVGFALSGEGADDGFVSMAEISTEYFTADLVVISACSTAQGEIVPGEGALSLGRAFLAQGVNSVISTLWPVSDRATAIFMKEFYRSLKVDGATYDVALQSAQGLLQRDPQYRNPYYWAAFTLTSAVPLSAPAR